MPCTTEEFSIVRSHGVMNSAVRDTGPRAQPQARFFIHANENNPPL